MVRWVNPNPPPFPMWSTLILGILQLLVEYLKDRRAGNKEQAEEKLRRIEYAKAARRNRDKSGIIDALNGRVPNREADPSSGNGD